MLVPTAKSPLAVGVETSKGKQIRYTADKDGLQASAEGILENLRKGAIEAAVERQSAFGTPTQQKGNDLRSAFRVSYCKKCGQHWYKYTVEKRSGENWKEISEFTLAGFTEQVLKV